MYPLCAQLTVNQQQQRSCLIGLFCLCMCVCVCGASPWLRAICLPNKNFTTCSPRTESKQNAKQLRKTQTWQTYSNNNNNDDTNNNVSYKTGKKIWIKYVQKIHEKLDEAMGQKATTSTSTSLSCPHSLTLSLSVSPSLTVILSLYHSLCLFLTRSLRTAFWLRTCLGVHSCVRIHVCMCLSVCGSYEVILCLLCVYVRSIECDGDGVRRTATLTTAQNEEHENKVRKKPFPAWSMVNGASGSWNECWSWSWSRRVAVTYGNRIRLKDNPQ